jgi:hypothetical protein
MAVERAEEMPAGRLLRRLAEMPTERTVEMVLERPLERPLYLSEEMLLGMVYMHQYRFLTIAQFARITATLRRGQPCDRRPDRAGKGRCSPVNSLALDDLQINPSAQLLLAEIHRAPTGQESQRRPTLLI